MQGLATPEGWEKTRDILFDMWLTGVENPELTEFVRGEMGSTSADMWMRSGREIGGCYARGGSPVQAMSAMDPSVPILHLYSQPDDPGYLQGQLDYAGANPWYKVQKLSAHSHFPTLESADEIAQAMEEFVA